jgi:hypothetical protein
MDLPRQVPTTTEASGSRRVTAWEGLVSTRPRTPEALGRSPVAETGPCGA